MAEFSQSDKTFLVPISLSVMLNQSKGIVPQLVDQYNVLIEHNLCQSVNLVEFRDNRTDSVNEAIDEAIEQTVDNFADHCQRSESDSALAISVLRERTVRYLHQTNQQVLVRNSETVNPIVNNTDKKKNEVKDCHSNGNKDQEIPKSQIVNELVPIKLNSVLEQLIRRRKHNFLTKTIVSKEICGICGQSINFSEKYVHCVDCIAISHVVCANQLPLPCIRYTNPNLRPSKSISNYVYPAFRPSIPALLIHCVREVEQRCQESCPDSLYVLNSEGLKQVKDLINTLIKPKNAFHLLKNFNINIVCGVIKKFINDFNEPLITKDVWKLFSSNMKRKSDEELESLLKQTINDSNVANRETIALLIVHLKHLANNQKYICLENFVQVFCPIICGDTEVNRKLKLMSVLFEINTEFWIKMFNK